MAKLIGLFLRGGAYYPRIVLPPTHPLTIIHPCGRLVRALGPVTYRAAVLGGTVLRASVLGDHQVPPSAVVAPDCRYLTTDRPATFLRNVYVRWIQSKPLTADPVAACGRAFKLFEQQTGNLTLQQLTRSQSDAFRAWLQTLPTTSKTARDRLNWVKSLSKYGAQDLEILSKSPWVELDIKSRTNRPRHHRPYLATITGRLCLMAAATLGALLPSSTLVNHCSKATNFDALRYFAANASRPLLS